MTSTDPAAQASEPPAAPCDRLQRWELRPQCRLRPAQLLAACALPCVIALLFGLALAALGYPYALAYALLQSLVMGGAYLMHARRLGDRAVLTLKDGWLEVAKHRGSRLRVARLPLAWLRMGLGPRGLHFECGLSRVRIHGYASLADCAAVLRDLEQARREAVAVFADAFQDKGAGGPAVAGSRAGTLMVTRTDA